jgi:peptide/nickel transport system substrate-binding protein
VARSLILAAAIAASLLAVSGAGSAPAQTPKRGGTVVVATNDFAEPQCLSWLPVCDPLLRAEWRNKVLALPFAPGPYGLRNDLVETYELSKDPFTVVFHARPQARWSDGVPITARDFVFAYETYREHSGLPKDDPLRTEIRRVQRVDAKTVRFVFRAPYGNWKAVLNFAPLPSHVLRGEDLGSEDLWRHRIDNPKTGQPMGSGPFLVGDWELGTQVTLVRNPRYWGRHKAYIDRLKLRFVRGAPTVEQLGSGEFDLGVVGTPPPELAGDPRFRMLPTQGNAWQHFEIRVDPGGHPALTKKLVRRALAYGIDRVALVRALYGASAPPVLDNTIYLTSERGYEPNWKGYRYRPAEARRLLRQAGCSRGSDGIYSCSGERLRLRFITTAGVDLRQRVLELVATQLRRAGVEVEPMYAPNEQLFDAILPAGDFDVALFASSKPEPEDADSPYRCGGSYSGYCTRLVKADLDQLDRTLKPARRVVVANRIDRRLAADVPALPLFTAPLTYVLRKGLQGVVANGFGALTTGGTLWNAENWWLER